jgi:hypothetical protein
MNKVKPEIQKFLSKSAELTGETPQRMQDVEASEKIVAALFDEAKRKIVVLDIKFDDLKNLLKSYVDLVDETDEVVTQTLTLLRDKLKLQKMEGKF